MKNEKTIVSLVAGLCACLAVTVLAQNSVEEPGSSPSPENRKPNVIVLFIDDLGYGDVGAFGCPDIPTPNIDSLATAGVRCVNGYTTAPVCTPSRTAMITGMYQQRNGVYILGHRGLPIMKDHPTIAEFMRDAGYVTGMVGRWDVGEADQGPLDRGFMEVARRSFAEPSDPRRFRKKSNYPTYIQEDGVYWTERQGKEMAEFVGRHKDTPFFLYFAPLAVHFPVEEVPQKYLKRVPDEIKNKKRRFLAGTLIALDDAIGVLLESIKAHRLEEDTLIVFTSDNGGYERDGARNAPFKGGKATIWDGGVHEPYIVKWPGVIPAGTTYTGLISTLDVYATAAAVAGRTAPERCDGNNFLPYLTGEKRGDVQDALFFCAPGEAMRQSKWRLVRSKANESWQLYDMEADPGETVNVADKHPNTVNDMAQRYLAWKETLRKFPPRCGKSGGRCPVGIGWASPDNP